MHGSVYAVPVVVNSKLVHIAGSPSIRPGARPEKTNANQPSKISTMAWRATNIAAPAKFIGSVRRAAPDRLIAIDGKAQRGSKRRNSSAPSATMLLALRARAMHSPMSTVAEIESAVAGLVFPQKREVFDFLSATLEAEGGTGAFPDLKGLLMEFPDVGTDEDFARIKQMPRDLDLS